MILSSVLTRAYSAARNYFYINYYKSFLKLHKQLYVFDIVIFTIIIMQNKYKIKNYKHII